jgi:hypothetical protein
MYLHSAQPVFYATRSRPATRFVTVQRQDASLDGDEARRWTATNLVAAQQRTISLLEYFTNLLFRHFSHYRSDVSRLAAMTPLFYLICIHSSIFI